MFSADHLTPGRVTVPRRGGKVISTPPEDEPKDFQHSKRKRVEFFTQLES